MWFHAQTEEAGALEIRDMTMTLLPSSAAAAPGLCVRGAALARPSSPCDSLVPCPCTKLSKAAPVLALHPIASPFLSSCPLPG